MGKSKLTTAEDKLLQRGFDYATDLNVFDPYYDDTDVLRQLEIDPNLKATELSKLTKLPSHRVIAAMMRLKTAGKFPVKPPAGIVVNFPGQEIIESEPLAVEEPLTVITLWQPWATFIIKGIKTYETRSWPTNYRGRILIHAAKRPINWEELDVESLECYHPDVKNWDYPLGAIVGEASLESCTAATYNGLKIVESICGDFETGRFAWKMRSPKPLFIPNVKGKQGLWKYELDNVVLGETVLSDEPKIDLLSTDPPRQIEANGQLSLFFDNSEEPPDPDDFKTLDEYHQQHELWSKDHPELTQAMAERIALTEKSKVVLGESTKIVEDTTSTTKEQSENVRDKFCEVDDYIQLKSDPRRIGQITGLKFGGFYKIKFADGFAAEFKSDQFEYRPFSKANSEIVLGESFFKIGEQVTTSSPGFEGKVFTVSTIYPTGMIGVIHNGNNLSFPANWLNHHIEKIESKAKSIPLEQTEVTTRKRPAKGCGSGYLMVRSANVKRNEAKGKSPDIYYVYCFSYTNQYGKEIKSSLSVPRAKIAQVKSMVENKEHYVKIAKFLGKNLPLSY